SKPAPKDAPTTLEEVRAKGGEPTNEQPPADAKLGPAESSHEAGHAKTGDRKDATLDDVAKLREQLSEKAQHDLAKKALEKISDQERSWQTRQRRVRTLKPGNCRSRRPSQRQPGRRSRTPPRRRAATGKPEKADRQAS